jgi:cell division septation protein DedD
MNGDAWRPFVFRFGDDAVYGDITDPSNRNENWRIRYPSSKYEVRRIDKSPEDLLDHQTLPIRISMTGAEDYIIKRIEVVVYRAKQGLPYRPLSIVKLGSYNVNYGEMVTLSLNQGLPSKNVDFYIIDPVGREHRITPRILNTARDKLAFDVEGYPFSESGPHQIKVVDRSNSSQPHTMVENFTIIRPKPFAPPAPAPPVVPNPPTYLPPIPEAPPTYIVPMPPPASGVPPVAPVPPMMVPPGPPVDTFPPSYSRGYTIQIGAYQAQASAVTMMNELRGYGYDAYISEAVQGGRRLFRVRVGKYPTKSLALQDADRLQSNGFDIWVTTLI